MNTTKRLILGLAFLLIVLLIAELTGLRDHFTLQLLRDKLASNALTGILIFIALFSIGNLLHIPGLIFLAGAVFALGRLYGGLVTYLAALISCAITFQLVHYLGGDVLRKIKNKVAVRLIGELDAHPVRNVVLLRIIFQTLAALNYTLALSGVRFRQYMIGTMIGLPIPIALYCFFFDEVAKYLHLT